MVCKDLKAFADDWNNTLKAQVEKKVTDMELRADFNDVESPIRGFLRSLERELANLPDKQKSGYMNPGESVQRGIDNLKVNMHFFVGKWVNL